MNEPHLELLPLLEKHEVSWELFSKQGRPPKGVSAKRKAVVTELHLSGMSWDRMIEVTGKSLGFIQRNTQAMWNEASRENSRKNGERTGRLWKGKKRPGQLERQWADGTFDFHKGRKRSPEECQKLCDSWTEEKRAKRSQEMKARWEDPNYRTKLEKIHRSPENRALYSRLQVERMAENPEKWSRGKGQYVPVSKCTGKEKIWVRSSYEVVAVNLLENDPEVSVYDYERRCVLENGKWILPDFIVTRTGRQVLTEVKSEWVFSLPADSKEQQRLKIARELATKNGWGFEIWAEQELGLKHVP